MNHDFECNCKFGDDNLRILSLRQYKVFRCKLVPLNEFDDLSFFDPK